MKDATEKELEVLKVLWSRGTGTVRQIAGSLYPEGGPSAHATVQKLLDRLEGKGFVSRQPEGRAYVYRSEIARDGLIRNRLRETADRLCEGSLTPLLTQLVSGADLSPKEIETLRKLVEGLDHDD